MWSICNHTSKIRKFKSKKMANKNWKISSSIYFKTIDTLQNTVNIETQWYVLLYLQVSCKIRNNLETKVLLVWERKRSSINCNWVCNQHRRLQADRIHQHHSPARYILLFNRKNIDSFSDNSVSDIFAVDAEARVLPGGLS